MTVHLREQMINIFLFVVVDTLVAKGISGAALRLLQGIVGGQQRCVIVADAAAHTVEVQQLHQCLLLSVFHRLRLTARKQHAQSAANHADQAFRKNVQDLLIVIVTGGVLALGIIKGKVQHEIIGLRLAFELTLFIKFRLTLLLYL